MLANIKIDATSWLGCCRNLSGYSALSFKISSYWKTYFSERG